MFRRCLSLAGLAALVVLVLLVTDALAKKPPKPPPEPPADPDICFSPGSGVGPLLIMNDDGTEVYALPTSDHAWSSSWSPDGAHIAFDTGSKLYQIDADGTDELLLDSDGVEPAWSPNDDWIAYSGDFMTSLEVIPPGGGTALTLHSVGEDDWIESPTWNAAGTKIAFLEQITPNPKQLRMVDVATGAITTIGPLDTSRIDWARMKDVLVYHSGGDIYTFDLGSETSTLHVEDGRWASWSPDDSQIVFSRIRRGWELYKFTFATETTTPVKSGRGKKALPGRLADWKR